jgi:hypothetical protein
VLGVEGSRGCSFSFLEVVDLRQERCAWLAAVWDWAPYLGASSAERVDNR